LVDPKYNPSGLISYAEIRQKLKLVLGSENQFYIVTFVYGLGVGVLTLAIPISVQSLVNTVSSNVLIQPLVVLSLLLLSLLIFSGILKAFQTYIIESFQRRFYARTSSEISVKILNASYSQTNERNAVELMNRYFDVMTVQKTVAKLLTDGVSLILKTVVGLLLLAFYHPYFLVFDVLLVILIALVWKIYGKAAIKSAIYESKAKYQVASWLEELARANFFFKTDSKKKRALKKSDDLIHNYLNKRESHFKKLFSQKIFLLIIYAFMSALVLGLGGYLVINGELSLGQLVAAELIVTVILSSLSNSAKYLESFYDLYAAVDKISSFHGLTPETSVLLSNKEPLIGGDLNFDSVRVNNGKSNLFYDFNFKAGSTYIIESKVYSSKQFFLSLIQQIEHPHEGEIKLGNQVFGSLSPIILRDEVHVITKTLTFEGSIRENLSWGKDNIKDSELTLALQNTYLGESLNSFEDGLDTLLLPSGYPFWSSQLFRFEIARALINKPKILVLTEVFDQIEDKRILSMMKELQKLDITIIYVTNKNLNNMLYEEKLILDERGLSRYEDE
jgi:putative ABC transport system ATP-binding protein